MLTAGIALLSLAVGAVAGWVCGSSYTRGYERTRAVRIMREGRERQELWRKMSGPLFPDGLEAHIAAKRAAVGLPPRGPAC